MHFVWDEEQKDAACLKALDDHVFHGCNDPGYVAEPLQVIEDFAGIGKASGGAYNRVGAWCREAFG